VHPSNKPIKRDQQPNRKRPTTQEKEKQLKRADASHGAQKQPLSPLQLAHAAHARLLVLQEARHAACTHTQTHTDTHTHTRTRTRTRNNKRQTKTTLTMIIIILTFRYKETEAYRDARTGGRTGVEDPCVSYMRRRIHVYARTRGRTGIEEACDEVRSDHAAT
jgi:hypothetical protein